MEQPCKKRLYPGLRVLCPTCRRIMAIVRTEIKSGDVIKAEYFEAVEGILYPGQPMKCPYDGADYGSSGKLYVSGYEGWI